MGLMGVIATSTSSFNALGKPSPPLAISIVQMLFLSVPLAILGNTLFGYNGLLFGSVLSIGLTAILSYVWLRRTIKRRLSIGEGDAAPVG
jgi:Na+-driven multidrug efflux pump